MSDPLEDTVSRLVRTIEYNTGNGLPDAISATQVRVLLCGRRSRTPESVDKAIRVALKRGDIIEQDGKYAPADPHAYRKYL